MSNDTTTKVLPTHRIFSVMKGNDEGKAVWTEIGAAWANKDGEGFNLVFNALPLQGAGIVLRKPRAKKEVEVAA
ncbi:MAG: hypothetical protein ABSD74_17185 [Rhizomicrobium sp.]|jgi:hypothetical protein